jgi:hypothetical protein
VATQLITQPYHLPREAGPARWHLGALLTFKASDAPGGALAGSLKLGLRRPLTSCGLGAG